jgi:chitosanase
MLTLLQEQTIKAIINLFETSSVQGDYSSITLIPGDTGGLTYGRSQTTRSSGGLQRLVADYVGDPARPYAAALQVYLPIHSNDVALDADVYLHNLLRAAADFEVMRQIQDRFFDSRYWTPAFNKATALGVATPLGVAVVYDGTVHGSFDLIRTRTNAAVGTVAQAGERPWITRYVRERFNWLANSPRADLRKTVYRMNTFQALIDDDEWDLGLPLIVRDATINPQTLVARPPRVYDGPPVGSRDLAVGGAIQAGRDVRAVQVALTAPAIGERLKADGQYGNGSAGAVRRLQTAGGQPATGVANAWVFQRLRL